MSDEDVVRAFITEDDFRNRRPTRMEALRAFESVQAENRELRELKERLLLMAGRTNHRHEATIRELREALDQAMREHEWLAAIVKDSGRKEADGPSTAREMYAALSNTKDVKEPKDAPVCRDRRCFMFGDRHWHTEDVKE